MLYYSLIYIQIFRLMALDIEKSRAQKIASLPKPKPDPVDNIEAIKRMQLL